MKKYRYQEPKLMTPWRRYSPYLFMFLGWNIIACAAWSFTSQRAEESNPNFKNLSDAEKLVYVTGGDLSKIKRVKLSLFGKEKKEDEK